MRVGACSSSPLRLLPRLALCVYVCMYACVCELQGEAGGKQTLVVLDDMNVRNTHSLFFSSLKGRGHTISFVQSESQGLKLQEYGEYLYQNIILIAPTLSESSNLGVQDLTKFVNDGGNVMMIVDESLGTEMKEFAEECGVDFDSKGSRVIDHFEFDAAFDASKQHTAVKSHKHIDSYAVLGAYASQPSPAPVLFQGIGHAVEHDNILALRILMGNPSTYSEAPNKPIKEYPRSAGHDTLLVSAMQARNNARVTFAGSVAMFSNVMFTSTLSDGSSTGNALFCTELVKWSLADRGILRFRDVRHHKSDGSLPDVMLHEKQRPDLPVSLYPDPEIARNSLVYRVNDEIVYSFVLEKYEEGVWSGFEADDVQLEFVMLDPYVRKTMTGNSGLFTATIKAPDTYGIFKFRVMYRRTGWSVININTQVALRPFKHNEYERFIFAAYPYYASAFSMMLGFFVFCIVFLFSSDK